MYKILSNDVGTNWISVAINAMPTNMSLYCTTSKRTLLQRHIMNIDPPDIMFVGFFCEKHPPAMDKYIMVTPTHPHWVQIKHLMRNYIATNQGLMFAS